jgi:hypothetical protein
MQAAESSPKGGETSAETAAEKIIIWKLLK